MAGNGDSLSVRTATAVTLFSMQHFNKLKKATDGASDTDSKREVSRRTFTILFNV